MYRTQDSHVKAFYACNHPPRGSPPQFRHLSGSDARFEYWSGVVIAISIWVQWTHRCLFGCRVLLTGIPVFLKKRVSLRAAYCGFPSSFGRIGGRSELSGVPPSEWPHAYSRWMGGFPESPPPIFLCLCICVSISVKYHHKKCGFALDIRHPSLKKMPCFRVVYVYIGCFCLIERAIIEGLFCRVVLIL